MTRHARRTGSVAIALIAVVGLASCSSSEDAGAPTTTSTAVSSPTTAPEGGSSEGAGQDDAPVDCEAEKQAGKDQELLSESPVVMWTADSKSTRATADATAATTLTFQSDGSLDPSELTVDVNEVFAVVGDDDVRAVIIGCAAGQTIYGPAPAGFYITEPGTYIVTEEISETELATITVV